MHFLTDADRMTQDCCEGMSFVYPEFLHTLPVSYNGRGLLRQPIQPNRVNLIVSAGGGGGPFSQSFVVSPDLADASVNGGMFAAPSAYDIYEIAKEINSSYGYLLLYNNFMGDCLNNDLALELMNLEGLKGHMIAFHDDCLSVPEQSPREERTGLLGIVYGSKIAASYAKTGASLEEISGLLAHVNNRTSSLTITFDFSKKLLMLGEGISGEPAPLVYADQFTLQDAAAIAYDKLISDLCPKADEQLYVLINRMFPSNYEDTYILAKHLYEYAQDRIPLQQMSAGHFMRMSHSYGFSVTMLCANQQMTPHLQKRCFTDAFIV